MHSQEHSHAPHSEYIGSLYLVHRQTKKTKLHDLISRILTGKRKEKVTALLTYVMLAVMFFQASKYSNPASV